MWTARASKPRLPKPRPGRARGPIRSGPLHGVPLSVKSSVDVAGWPCECGSRLRKGYVPPEDATLVTRLRAAGAILLGNTNVPEFLMAYETDNSLYGRTNSPWDLERTPGGSSGGEAAAISAGCSAGGVGSDGGGSIRIPAHYAGICGLKPTPGRVPSSGHYPASAGPFAQLGVVGPMARTIADVARLFAVMAGPDIGDPASAPVPLRVWSDEEILKLRVAYFEDDGVTPVTAETAAAVRAAADALRQQGFQVEAWRPQNLDRVWQLWWNLFGRAVQMAFATTVEGRENGVEPDVSSVAGACGAGAAARWTRVVEHFAGARRVAREIAAADGNFSDSDCARHARFRRFVMASANGWCRGGKLST